MVRGIDQLHDAGFIDVVNRIAEGGERGKIRGGKITLEVDGEYDIGGVFE